MGRGAVLAYLLISLPLIVYPFVFTRTDMLACTVAVIGMGLIVKDRPHTGAVALAVSLFTKLWPLVLAPALLVRRQVKAFWLWFGLSALGGIAWVLWGGATAPWQVISYRHASGWQIESVIGAAWHLVTGGRVYEDAGSDRVGHMPAAAPVLLGLLALALVTLFWIRAQQFADSNRVVFGVAPLAAVTALLVTAALFSPQFMIWLVPWAAITSAPGEDRDPLDLAMGVCTALACAATVVSFRSAGQLVRGTWFGHAVIHGRNLLVVGILVLAWLRTRSAEGLCHHGDRRQQPGVIKRADASVTTKSRRSGARSRSGSWLSSAF